MLLHIVSQFGELVAAEVQLVRDPTNFRREKREQIERLVHLTRRAFLDAVEIVHVF